MKNPEIYRDLQTLLRPMADQYARRKKLAVHFDEALQGVKLGDPVVTDRGLRELYRSGRHLSTLHREQVLYCLKRLNNNDSAASTKRSGEFEKELKQSRSTRRHTQATTQRRLGFGVAALLLAGIALLKPDEFLGNVRFLGLGILGLLLIVMEFFPGGVIERRGYGS